MFRKLMQGLMVGAFLSVVLFGPLYSNAMPIPQYDAMSTSDQARYIADLFEYSVQMLLNQKRHEDAQRLLKLFERKSGAEVSEGVAEIKSAINGLRNLPNNKPYHVEHAFADTLRSHGLPLSSAELKQLAQAGKNFKPSDTLDTANGK